jgi:(p)ppGpp synthase/HD superfamily hydrolase
MRKGSRKDLGHFFWRLSESLQRSNGNERATLWTIQGVRPPSSHEKSSSKRANFSPKVLEAMQLAFRLHNRQARKGTKIPYLSHLTGVAGLVAMAGGSEKEIIAALLHDAVEDQGGKRTLQLINRRFGSTVAAIVAEVSENPTGTWEQRKRGKIAKIASGHFSPSALRVKVADNVHNSSTMIIERQEKGPAFWQIFSRGRSGTLWYYRGLLAAYEQVGLQSPLLKRLRANISRLEQMD